ncbi:MAG TPA: hypothetical protein VHG28_03755 [Longimicrobiaceae bacterium]|nr:hypothetical protein [Longimicrobiaceae bacterium]
MSRSRVVLALAFAAGIAACSSERQHNNPDEDTGSSAGQPATQTDSLVTGEAIQTTPPPAESAEPTATATGDTLRQSNTDSIRGGAGDTSRTP